MVTLDGRLKYRIYPNPISVFLAAPQTVLRIIEDIDLLGREPSDSETENTEQPPVEETVDVPKPHGLPMYKHGKPTEENLDGVRLT